MELPRCLMSSPKPRAVLQPVSSVLASKTRTIRRFIISDLNK
ncbi:hypothetical protein HMPREF9544_01490 [Escherichia coli MS 153-1]|uniref:Uncharacterized protein n=1 Tax=Escherichia coli MS 85-1 TaxID=679202 RepID=A0AAN3MA60_ECOLX|nr:hypothetical protein HMPREF9551_03881 [Escherichia coli MS 196-1]EFJ56865.1 hypothetical protein HMPREF9549_01685 [Escherichia coli MS 185-1]EFJ85749.1 hypothetical protein HMPREF9536_03962 [Escherichia coli MS 84-1]EFJ93957.1 hypothetical protein HMPREF9531_00918 [Escherichia coli MS 45-1]EFK47199.1 hypothetical protein HMPREF9346_01064 [Escherichia coli MS 119-7]EFK75086.1 hypothetical protein HMPREF9535_00929 [Escherichia coli MS 78-1]EFU35460.1 hypothetical protein HMPREF9350_02527 [Es